MKHFYSTLNSSLRVPLREAVLKGLADDGGLFMPIHIPVLPLSFIEKLRALSFPEISYEICKILLSECLPDKELKKIVEKAFTFDVPLISVAPQIYSLELFHGPTMSFKDFGARFMAQLMAYYKKEDNKNLNILVATSGDTGSAVGDAFSQVEGMHVWILYPKGKVSYSQEKQLTTLGDQVTALEIEGTFDDCQRLVKEAFCDKELRGKIALTSANSINIARLIPQTFYYFYAYSQLKEHSLPIAISVPSGNFGHLTAGLLAKRMGLPIQTFIAATNINDTVPRYLQEGIFEPRPSQHTLSNAMDVGNPSNFGRMLDLYEHDREKMLLDIVGYRFTDDETASAIRDVFENYDYLMDPHGAVAFLGLKHFFENSSTPYSGIFFETAHPAKFANEMEQIIHKNIIIPNKLQDVLNKKKKSILLSTNYSDLKNVLLT